MRNSIITQAIAVALLAAGLGIVVGGPEDSWSEQRSDGGLELSIKASPQTINLDSLSDGDWLTVHTDIGYGSVDRATLALNGIPVAFTFADSRGCLVAKFSLALIEEIVAPPSAVLTLTGATTAGLPLEGSDVVTVLDPQP